MIDIRVRKEVERHPYPLLFATISGAHLYGFPSPDSDYDIRGVHLLPLAQLLGLRAGNETVQVSGVRDGLEIDLVTHDAGKFFRMLLKRNGYVLEQLCSPLVVKTSAAHEELVSLSRACITRHHSHHYLGFAATQWRMFEKQPRVKTLLYVYRVLLTGVWMMRTGDVEANLVNLNRQFQLPYLPELLDRKVRGQEKQHAAVDVGFHRAEYERLVRLLEDTASKATLPEKPSATEALNDLLIRLRLR